MNTKQVIGIVMLILFFGGIIATVAIKEGIVTALLGFGVALLATAFVTIAAWLIEEGSDE